MKEFDIYLNKRLTECDIIVYSIPFREGLTVMNRLILESCIEHYELMKFIAVQTGSELVAHIDEMLKTCYERLNLGTEIDVSAEFNVLYSMRPQESAIVLGAEDVKLLATSFIQAESALQIAAEPLRVFISKPLGSGSSGIEINTTADMLKTDIERFTTQMGLGAELAGFKKRGAMDIDCGIPIGAELTNLCYRVTTAIDTSMEITAAVLGTELHFSLGGGENTIVLDAEIGDGLSATKHLAIANAVAILADVVTSVTQYMHPVPNALVFGASAEFVKRRFRLLAEMDENALLSYDDMTLDDVDYVVLG